MLGKGLRGHLFAFEEGRGGGAKESRLDVIFFDAPTIGGISSANISLFVFQ